MKRIAVFVGMLLTLPAFAEVAPVFYDDGVEYSDVEYDDGDIVFEEEETATEPVKAPVVPVGKPVGVRSSSASRVTASRAVPTATTPAGRRCGAYNNKFITAWNSGAYGDKPCGNNNGCDQGGYKFNPCGGNACNGR